MLPAWLLFTIAIGSGICGIGHLTRPEAWRWPHVPEGKTNRGVGLTLCCCAGLLIVMGLLTAAHALPNT